jgi:hypothetical protein
MVRKKPRPEATPFFCHVHPVTQGSHGTIDIYKFWWVLNPGSVCRCSFFRIPISRAPTLHSHLSCSHSALSLSCAPPCCAHSTTCFSRAPYLHTPPLCVLLPHLWPLHGRHLNPLKPEWGGDVPSHIALAQNLYVLTFPSPYLSPSFMTGLPVMNLSLLPLSLFMAGLPVTNTSLFLFLCSLPLFWE